jgi:hypothetical protein
LIDRRARPFGRVVGIGVRTEILKHKRGGNCKGKMAH